MSQQQPGAQSGPRLSQANLQSQPGQQPCVVVTAQPVAGGPGISQPYAGATATAFYVTPHGAQYTQPQPPMPQVYDPYGQASTAPAQPQPYGSTAMALGQPQPYGSTSAAFFNPAQFNPPGRPPHPSPSAISPHTGLSEQPPMAVAVYVPQNVASNAVQADAMNREGGYAQAVQPNHVHQQQPYQEPGYSASRIEYLRSDIHSYYIISWISCICCFWPLGIFAIILSRQANVYAARGDYSAAESTNSRAKTFAMVAIVLGIMLLSGVFV